MKKYVEKLTAGISSLAIIASISAYSIPVSANEFQSAQEQAFIESFESEDCQELAAYLVESEAVSLTEAASILELYEETLTVDENEDSSGETTYINVDSDFYSQTDLAPTDHYIGVVNSNMNRNVRGCLDFLFQESYSYYDNFCYTYHENVVTKLLPSYENGDLALTYKVVPDGTVTGTQTMCFLKIGAGTNALCESDVNSSISMVDTSHVGGFKMYTFAAGDIDHNGIIDVNDLQYLSDFLLARDQVISYEGEYEDVVRFAVGAAMDVNMDGKVNVFDLIMLKRICIGE